VPELRLEIIGEGPGHATVEAAARSFAFVHYRGRLTHRETVRAMSGWHVGGAPFRPLDSFYFSPLKLVEYMAAGICPVASDLPELRSLLADGERGVLVEPGNAGALARTLVELAHDPGRAADLGRRAREHALHTSSWSHNADRVLAALREPARLVG
jgi:glycosyltransferase involved in cell wall biosynthesis